jgi:hypothetical protein
MVIIKSIDLHYSHDYNFPRSYLMSISGKTFKGNRSEDTII